MTIIWVVGPPTVDADRRSSLPTRRGRRCTKIWLGRIRDALGDRVLELEHVGSTSVAGLAAKPVIDIDLTVADSSDEAAYVGDLEAIGYELRIREPNWHEHRCLMMERPRSNLHVWTPGQPGGDPTPDVPRLAPRSPGRSRPLCRHEARVGAKRRTRRAET